MAFTKRLEKIAMLAFLCAFVGPFNCLADKVILKSGEAVEGLVIDKNQDYVVLYADDKSNLFPASQVARIIHEASSPPLSRSEDSNRPGVVGPANDLCQSVSECSRLGFEVLAKSEADRAMSFFDAAIRHDPKNANALLGRGQAHMLKRQSVEAPFKMAEVQAALKDADEVVKLDLQHVSGWTLRADALRRLGRLEEAIADCEKAIALDPHRPKAYSVRARAYGEKGDYATAIKSFSEAAALTADKMVLSWVFISRAEIYVKMGDLVQAESDCGHAIQVDPTNASAYGLRAEIFASRKDYGRAWADVRKAQELGGKESPALLEELKKNAPSA